MNFKKTLWRSSGAGTGIGNHWIGQECSLSIRPDTIFHTHKTSTVRFPRALRADGRSSWKPKRLCSWLLMIANQKVVGISCASTCLYWISSKARLPICVTPEACSMKHNLQYPLQLWRFMDSKLVINGKIAYKCVVYTKISVHASSYAFAIHN